MATRAAQRALAVVLGVSLAGIIAVIVLVGAGRSGDAATAGAPSSVFDGPLLPPGLRAAGFSLTDQNGHRVTLASLRGRVVVLSFLHTRCVDLCPLTVENIKGALDQLGGVARDVVPVAITAAPAEDSAHARRVFLAEHHMSKRIVYLNGPMRSLQRVWNAYHVLPVLPGKPDHTAFSLLIDRRGIERVGFPDDQMTPELLAHDLRVLARERA